MYDSADVEAIRTLVEFEALRQLKARYLRLLDEQRWDEWGELFTEDLEFSYPFENVEFVGRDKLVARVRGNRSGGRSAHHGHMPELELTGPDTARGIWALEDFVENRMENGTRVTFHGFGYYHEKYVKRDGKWLIASLKHIRLRVDTLETRL